METQKFYFYTATAAGIMHNGVLRTTAEFFSIRFLIDVALKGKPNIIVHWWQEIPREQVLDYVGEKEMTKLEATLKVPKQPTVLRLVRDDEPAPKSHQMMNLDTLIDHLENIRTDDSLKGKNVPVLIQHANDGDFEIARSKVTKVVSSSKQVGLSEITIIG